MNTANLSNALGITRCADRIELTHAGTAEPLLVHHAATGERPYLHPVRTPRSGTTVTEDRPAHHPWQHGLYFGLNGVNGVGFWTEGLYNDPEKDGRIRVISADAGSDTWHVTSDWCEPGGDVLMSDRVEGSARLIDDTLEIDLLWTITARVAITLTQYNYGGLFLRMPYRTDCQATLLTPTGNRTPGEAEGAALPWLGVAMQIDAAVASVVILNAPGNPDAPALWRADGEYGIGPAIQRKAALVWPAGHAVRYAYRVSVSDGTPSAELLAATYKRYTGAKL